jgi:hypothetical protein
MLKHIILRLRIVQQTFVISSCIHPSQCTSLRRVAATCRRNTMRIISDSFVHLCVFVDFIIISKFQFLPHNVNAVCGEHAELSNVKMAHTATAVLRSVNCLRTCIIFLKWKLIFQLLKKLSAFCTLPFFTAKFIITPS